MNKTDKFANLIRNWIQRPILWFFLWPVFTGLHLGEKCDNDDNSEMYYGIGFFINILWGILMIVLLSIALSIYFPETAT